MSSWVGFWSILFENFNDVQINDTIEAYTVEEVAQKLG